MDINKCTAGIKMLCDKYGIMVSDWQISDRSQKNFTPLLNVAGREVPLLSWRYDPRFPTMKNCTKDGTIKDISSLKVFRIDHKSTNLKCLIFRELDLCQWLADSEIEYIYALANSSDAINIIARLTSGIVCTIELAATLAEKAQPMDKHEIISAAGLVIDRTVDTQIPQNSVYLFTDDKNSATYTDIDTELYGLDIAESTLVRNAYDLLKNQNRIEETIQTGKKLEKLVAAVFESAKTEKKIVVGGIAQ